MIKKALFMALGAAVGLWVFSRTEKGQQVTSQAAGQVAETGQAVGSSISEGVATVSQYIAQFFKPGEFGGWFDQLNPALLPKLDAFRAAWGAPVSVSQNAEAVGRHGGTTDTSQHNVDKWGYVNAVDVFPAGLNPDNFQRAVDLARQVGFTGIGIYTDTSKPMMHLDVRAGKLATWARIAGKYTGLSSLGVAV